MLFSYQCSWQKPRSVLCRVPCLNVIILSVAAIVCNCEQAPFCALWCTKIGRASLAPKSSQFTATILHVTLCGMMTCSFFFLIVWQLVSPHLFDQISEALWNHGCLRVCSLGKFKSMAFQRLRLRAIARKEDFHKLILGTSVLCCCHRKGSLKEPKCPKQLQCWYWDTPSKAVDVYVVLPL